MALISKWEITIKFDTRDAHSKAAVAGIEVSLNSS